MVSMRQRHAAEARSLLHVLEAKGLVCGLVVMQDFGTQDYHCTCNIVGSIVVKYLVFRLREFTSQRKRVQWIKSGLLKCDDIRLLD